MKQNRKGKTVLSLLLVLALAFSLAACGSSKKETSVTVSGDGTVTASADGSTVTASGENVTIDNLALRANGEAGLLYENDGLKLFIPVEYGELLDIVVPENAEDGTLFSVSEKASVEAARAQGNNVDGAGWLFGIQKIDEETMKNLVLGTDLSGIEIFAKDSYGYYYVYNHPTDVRYVRENNEAMARDQEQWTALNEWAFGKVRQSMLDENPQLMSSPVGSTDLDLLLARIAYLPDQAYVLSSLEYGEKELNTADFDASSFVERLMKGVRYEMVEEEAPDGEYLVLRFPEEGTRFDFFLMEGKENYIREVGSSGMETMYVAHFDDATLNSTGIVQEWYYAAVGATPDGAAGAGLGSGASGLLGGWTASESTRMSEELTAAFGKAMEGLTGVGYEPVACLAQQVVSGTNYAILCKAQVVYPDAQPYYALVYLYQDLQGNAELLKIAGLSPNGEYDANAGTADALLGGWSVAEDQETGLAAFMKASESLLGVNYTPIQVLSSQVVSGTNYCVLCRAEVVSPEARPYYTLATVYEDLSGNASITEFRDLDIAGIYEAA